MGPSVKTVWACPTPSCDECDHSQQHLCPTLSIHVLSEDEKQAEFHGPLKDKKKKKTQTRACHCLHHHCAIPMLNLKGRHPLPSASVQLVPAGWAIKRGARWQSRDGQEEKGDLYSKSWATGLWIPYPKCLEPEILQTLDFFFCFGNIYIDITRRYLGNRVQV